jgi:hypothetical protein
MTLRFATPVIALGCLCGCTWPEAKPAARPEKAQPPREQREAPLLVGGENAPATSQPADADIDPRVKKFIDNIDGAARAKKRAEPARPPDNAAGSDERTVGGGESQAADANRSRRAAAEPTRPDGDEPRPAGFEWRYDQPAPPARHGADEAAPATNQPTAVSSDQAPSVPAVTEVIVRADSARGSEPTSPLPPPAANAPASARRLPATLREFVAALPAKTGDASFREQLDARLLAALAGDDQRARQPLELVPEEQQKLAAAFVEALIALRQSHPGEPGEAVAAARREFERLLGEFERTAELKVPALVICSAVRGFGLYDEIQPPTFLAGQVNEFVSYCEVSGFKSEKQSDDSHLTLLDLKTTLLTRAGDVVLRLDDPGVRDVCRKPRRDFFISRLIQLPATLAPGDYVLKVTVVDRLGEKVTENRATFRILAGQP